MNKYIPLIKEYRLSILLNSLNCFDKYPFERDKQRDCVVKNYNISKNKDKYHWDKSVFRGMVIPSLTYLKLIYGSKDELKISSNGKLFIEAQKFENKFNLITQLLIYDIDASLFCFIQKMHSESLSKKEFLERISNEIEGVNRRQKIERINKWLSMLEQAKLVQIDKNIKLNTYALDTITNLFKPNNKDVAIFKKILLKSYKKLSINSAGIIKIDELRKSVLLDYLYNQNKILISSIFDNLFRLISLGDENFIISLGKPMRASEMLLLYNKNYYDTIHIKFLKQNEAK